MKYNKIKQKKLKNEKSTKSEHFKAIFQSQLTLITIIIFTITVGTNTYITFIKDRSVIERLNVDGSNCDTTNLIAHQRQRLRN